MSNIKKNDVFSLDVAPVKDSHGDTTDGYAVTNIQTGVREYESFCLAEADAFIEQLTSSTAEILASTKVLEVLHS